MKTCLNREGEGGGERKRKRERGLIRIMVSSLLSHTMELNNFFSTLLAILIKNAHGKFRYDIFYNGK